MDDIRIFLYRTTNNTIESMSECYNELIRQYNNRFVNKVIDIINNDIRGISDYRIEEWVDELLIDELKSQGRQKIDRIRMAMEERTSLLRSRLENQDQEPSILMKQYEESLIEAANHNNQYWLEEIVEEFKMGIRRKLLYFCDPFNGYTQQNIEYKIDDVSYEIKRILSMLIEDFQEEYKKIIKNEIKKNVEKVKEKVNRLEQNIQLTEEIERFSKLLEYSGFTLIQENDRLYAQDIKSKENKYELRYNENTQTLISIDNSIVFQIKNKFSLSINKKRDKMIYIAPNCIQTFSVDQEYHQAIIKTDNNYEFYYGYKKVTNIEEISIVIDCIKNISPKFYDELLKDPSFQTIMFKIEKHQEETKEIFKDKMDGKVKINPKTKPLVIKKLRLLGFFPIEKEDGLYLKDLITKEEYKMLNENYWLNPRKANNSHISTYDEYLCTDMHVVDKNISLNNTKMRRNGSWLNISNELSLFNFTIGDKQYRVKLTETGMVCQTKTKDTPASYISENELMSSIKDEFPFVVEHFEQHLSNIRRNNIGETRQQSNRKR